jgi:hypothetical protein
MGLWFEIILMQMLLRYAYDRDPRRLHIQYALTEIADECRHSIMFARATGRMVEQSYRPPLLARELGRAFKTVATGESAYAAILVAEEVLDVMQRDWMRDRRVERLVRQVNHIHVVEESRHMVFAREETRERLAGAGRGQRWVSALVIALAADMIVSSMIGREVYANAGLDADRALKDARHNEHHRSLLRTSCVNLMDFLGSVGLLTPAAARVYRRTGLL